MKKAGRKDLKIGATFYIRDHAEWHAIKVEKIIQGEKGPKVHFIDEAGKQGKRQLTDLYLSEPETAETAEEERKVELTRQE